jgi:hypothetical protein
MTPGKGLGLRTKALAFFNEPLDHAAKSVASDTSEQLPTNRCPLIDDSVVWFMGNRTA